MKKNLLLAFVALAFASCQQSTENTETPSADSISTSTADVHTSTAALSFATDTHNYGDIKKGEVVAYSFKFKNTGKEPLIIKDALATCGCTVPEIPKEPIKPGEEGELRVVFDSSGKPAGPMSKEIVVSSNAINSPVSITVSGTIKE